MVILRPSKTNYAIYSNGQIITTMTMIIIITIINYASGYVVGRTASVADRSVVRIHLIYYTPACYNTGVEHAPEQRCK